MSHDSVEPVCPFRADRFIGNPLESKGRGGFKRVEEDGEGLLQTTLPLFLPAASLAFGVMVKQWWSFHSPLPFLRQTLSPTSSSVIWPHRLFLAAPAQRELLFVTAGGGPWSPTAYQAPTLFSPAMGTSPTTTSVLPEQQNLQGPHNPSSQPQPQQITPFSVSSFGWLTFPSQSLLSPPSYAVPVWVADSTAERQSVLEQM